MNFELEKIHIIGLVKHLQEITEEHMHILDSRIEQLNSGEEKTMGLEEVKKRLSGKIVVLQ
jgi:hypothetical protein